MDEENHIEELKKRTGQEDDSEDTLDQNSTNDGALNLLSPEDDEEAAVESKKEAKKKSEVELKPGKQFKPNPYEEKFHSELSFVSFVLGIFGLILPLFSALAIIFGIGGLMQTHREHMKGKWMAILGIILGFIGIVIIIVAIVFDIGFLEKYLLQFGTVDTLTGAAHTYFN
ncbi:DUF4190 domain-containing protein [Candidatus Woesearchaeota archaeon]|jgi:hypothetical protein|nr:DUF4190 domain-containing protein [Candidatus Woesearchaeota archaeon]